MSGRRRPIERVVDAAIAVPVSIIAATRQLIPIASTRTEQAIAHRLSKVRRSPRSGAVDRPRPAPAVVEPTVERAAPIELPVTDAVEVDAPATDDLAIVGYDHLSARQIVDRLADLSPDELEAVADYERLHRRRQTVLSRIAQLT